jgi:hypothetical protein
VLAFVFASTGIPVWLPPAPIVRLGIPSPLTGMTRSFVAMASGNPTAAFAWHPLGPLLFAACVAMPAVALASWIRARRFDQAVRILRALWPLLAVMLAVVWARQIVVSP